MADKRKRQTVAMQGVILRFLAYVRAYKATVSVIHNRMELFFMIKQDYAQQEYKQEQHRKEVNEHWATFGIAIVGCTFTMMLLLSI
tara:strand:- start:312 stop:569 length:258 start_codon:yes stop_codon:yes gene_type:complete